MREMVETLVQRETAGLRGAMRRDETAKAMNKLRRDRERRQWLAEEEARDAKKSTAPSGSNPPPSPLAKKPTVPAGSNPSSPSAKKSTVPAAIAPSKPPVLSAVAKREIDRLTALRCTKHASVLAQVRQALASMGDAVFEKHFKHIVCLIVSLGHQHPRICWSLRQALHQRGVDGKRSHWAVERQLYRWMHRRDAEPLQKLVRMAGKGD
jgi:hypothetical protein